MLEDNIKTRVIKHLRQFNEPIMLYRFKSVTRRTKELLRALKELEQDRIITVISDYGKIKYRLNT